MRVRGQGDESEAIVLLVIERNGDIPTPTAPPNLATARGALRLNLW